MSIGGKQIAVLVYNYFEQSEFEEPIKFMEQAGADITVISTDKMELRGLKHIELGDEFQADLLLHEAISSDYDALIIPGGTFNADNLRVNEEAQDWAMDFLNSDRPIGVICHAPWLLVSADAVEGRRLTSYHTIKDDIINAGGEWIDLAVVIDNNLITSRQPKDLPKFNNTLVSMLSQKIPGTIQSGVNGSI